MTMTMFNSLKAWSKRNLLFYLEIIHAASGFTKYTLWIKKLESFRKIKYIFSFRKKELIYWSNDHKYELVNLVILACFSSLESTFLRNRIQFWKGGENNYKKKLSSENVLNLDPSFYPESKLCCCWNFYSISKQKNTLQ
jgi:hypothetical protein